jgi:hypothetical protein
VQTKTALLLSLVTLSVLLSVYNGVLLSYHAAPREGLLLLCQGARVVLLVLWVDADSKDHPDIYRPFEYGYLLLLFLWPYLPYYLWRTRRARGLLLLAGFVGLFYLPNAVTVAIYAAR